MALKWVGDVQGPSVPLDESPMSRLIWKVSPGDRSQFRSRIGLSVLRMYP
jgi:hypothetical protein